MLNNNGWNTYIVFIDILWKRLNSTFRIILLYFEFKVWNFNWFLTESFIKIQQNLKLIWKLCQYYFRGAK